MQYAHSGQWEEEGEKGGERGNTRGRGKESKGRVGGEEERGRRGHFPQEPADHLPVQTGPRPSLPVPEKVYPVPLLQEHQSWFPANPKVPSFEVWQIGPYFRLMQSRLHPNPSSSRSPSGLST